MALERFVSDTIETLVSGFSKRLRGEKVTYVEKRALKAHDKAVAEGVVREFVRSVPVALLRKMSGEPKRGLDRLARAYRLPVEGRTVDLYALFPALFAALESEVDVTGEGSKALERLREANADLKALDLAERRGELVSVSETREKLLAIATIMRARSEAMARAGGPAVQRAFEALLEELEQAVNRWYPEDGVADAIDED